VIPVIPDREGRRDSPSPLAAAAASSLLPDGRRWRFVQRIGWFFPSPGWASVRTHLLRAVVKREEAIPENGLKRLNHL
jgi:hypothetical protein